MTLTLVTGPGGVGCTTVADAVARTLARAESDDARPGDPRVVLVTTAADLPAGADDPAAAGILVLRPDVRRFVERCGSVGGPAGTDTLQPLEVAAFPGVDLLAVVGTVADVVRNHPGLPLVVDAGARAVELVGIVERLSQFADALVPQGVRILRSVTGRSPRPLAVWDALLDAVLPGAAALASCSAIAVLPAESHRMSGSALQIAQLSLFGVGVAAVVVRGQDAEIPDGLPSAVARIRWPHGDPAPDLRVVVDRASPAGGTQTAADGPPDAGGCDPFALPIPLPCARRDQLELVREQDALVVGVGEVSRRLDLPPLLTRCSVTGAEFDRSVLTVRFTPDPDRWPAAVPTPATVSAAGGRDE